MEKTISQRHGDWNVNSVDANKIYQPAVCVCARATYYAKVFLHLFPNTFIGITMLYYAILMWDMYNVVDVREETGIANSFEMWEFYSELGLISAFIDKRKKKSSNSFFLSSTFLVIICCMILRDKRKYCLFFTHFAITYIWFQFADYYFVCRLFFNLRNFIVIFLLCVCFPNSKIAADQDYQ